MNSTELNAAYHGTQENSAHFFSLCVTNADTPQPFAKIEHSFIDELAPQLGAYAIAVYMVLKRHSDASGYCYPSLSTIAAKIGASVPTVTKALKKLSAFGLLEWRNDNASSGARTSNVYRVHSTPQPRLMACKRDLQHPINDVYIPCKRDLHEQKAKRKNQEKKKQATPREQRAAVSQLENSQALANLSESVSETAVSLDAQDVEQQLIALGVTENTARALCADNLSECRKQLDALPARERIKDTAAYLVKAIQGAYSLPKTEQAAAQAATKAAETRKEPKAAPTPEQQKRLAEWQQRVAARGFELIPTHLQSSERKAAERADSFYAYMLRIWPNHTAAAARQLTAQQRDSEKSR